MRLEQVFYVSRAVADRVDEREVRSILALSQRNNRRTDITGCLLYSGRHFVQVLEGASPALDALIPRIAADPRHSDVVVVVRQAATLRRFPEWSMGLMYRLDLADRVERLLAQGGIRPDAALSLMEEVRADSVMGAL